MTSGIQSQEFVHLKKLASWTLLADFEHHLLPRDAALIGRVFDRRCKNMASFN